MSRKKALPGLREASILPGSQVGMSPSTSPAQDVMIGISGPKPRVVSVGLSCQETECRLAGSPCSGLGKPLSSQS